MGNILRKEKERETGSFTEKRKELVSWNSGAPSGFHQKNPKTFGWFQGSGSSVNTWFRGEARSVKPLFDRDGKRRKYFCKRCKKNHPEEDCEGNLVEFNFCHVRGHREYECYIKKRSGN